MGSCSLITNRQAHRALDARTWGGWMHTPPTALTPVLDEARLAGLDDALTPRKPYCCGGATR